uniref:ornithine decarboxylase n=1 Tax=Blastobotrys adeninivorans TaxID=409370 RepID=A0A060TJU0_BLAAD
MDGSTLVETQRIHDDAKETPAVSRRSSGYFSDDSISSISSAITLAEAELPKHLGDGQNCELETYLDQASQRLVAEAFHSRIREVDLDNCVPGSEDSFFVADLGLVYRQHRRWIANLPQVEPFYAVKCNGDPQVLQLMVNLGLGFDCASKNELDVILNLGVNPSKIVYANPCKTPSYLRFAKSRDVSLMTFDNADELRKCKKYYPDAQLLLRIMTDDSSALCQLSVKFGAPMSAAKPLLALAKELELNVVGVAFHVGSGATDPSAFTEAVSNARSIFDLAEQELQMPPMTVLDVGGGFESHSFEPTAKVLSGALDQYGFSSDAANGKVRIIAEPGRYYVSQAFSIATHVIGRRVVEGSSSAMLYVNDGVYGNLNCILFDHQNPVPRVLSHQGRLLHGVHPANDGEYEMSVWGPTCDGLDCITKSCKLPVAVDIGDWMYFDDMGAYTLCAASAFNGFETHDSAVVYVCSDPRAFKYLKS